MIKPELLTLFCAVIENKNITKSAEKMGLSQPRASKMLTQLDDILGFQSFKRVKRRLQPTADGKLFYQYAKETLYSLEQLDNKAKQIKLADKNKIIIAAMPSIANGFLVEVIAEFTQQHPDIKIQLILESSPEVINAVKKGTVDIGIAMRVPSAAAYYLEHIKAEKVAIIPKQHPLEDQDILSCQQLIKYPFVYIGVTPMNKVSEDELFNFFKKLPEISFHTSTHTVGCHFVANNMGCAIIDPYTAKSNYPLGYSIKELKEDIPFHFSILSSNISYDSEIKSTFFHFLKTKCASI
ncbi:LysR family transcriptional regulator [Vibrio sp. SS-MA-C1-2]|uniref:LysR family transcriptional regulator n=1 Tax=Vibrio sp. SS-MA-C1-2 TaxID=2908646 RepID=UPI001F31A938|nr:LysR family transcriptional regulator [Vibrio sp. SS-MA-C1-2]UJF18466.1 LysR family transcriptional regulator [Vibrio sp. SS-MA-C1-2]